jgi:hypothetical protein
MKYFTTVSGKLSTAFLVAFLIAATAQLSKSQTNETLSSGAFIINMGVTPQTVGNGLKPYGMIYDLVKNYQVPIKWVINPGKVKDGIDFSYGGTDFKGGPFIVQAEYRTAAVNARITYWQSQGVVGVTTTSPITVPVYTTVYVMPRWTLDQQNGSIATGFFVNAGIPPSAHGGSSSSGWKLPSQLTCCDDLFVMPHADPIWSTHGNLYSWNLNCNGSIWLACHSGSALEDMFNTSTPSQQTNFLAEKTGVATGGGPWSENALKLWGNHGNGTLPYTYNYHDDPVMQFMGILDGATQNGSEQIYIPMAAGWRPSTKVGVYDPDHPDRFSNNPEHRPAVLAYGRGFGDTNRGFVMLEAAHTINKATLPANIAAQRAFFNFSLLTAIERAVIPDPVPVLAIGDTLYSGISVDWTFNLPPGYDPANYTVQWSSSCGGTFTPTSMQRNVTFTPPNVTVPTPCFINIEITDACGRKFSNNKKVVVLCAISATASVTHPACNGAATGSVTMTVGGAPAPFTYNWSRISPAGTGSGNGTTISGLIAGTYNITITADNGCAATLSATLTEPAALSIAASPTHLLCNGSSTGVIDLTVSGGTPAYTYNWGGGVTTEDRGGLTAGSYTVTVTDANGCTATNTTNLTQPTAINVTPTLTHVNCFGQNTGAITLSVTGGTGSYTFAWGDGPTTQNRSSLTAGTYSLTITDGNNCQSVHSFAITQPAAALSLSTSVTNIVCGVGTGAINLTVSGGTAPYNYDWADVAGTSNSEDRSGLSAGVYTVTVTDNKGCTAVTSATVSSTSGASISSNITHVICFGQPGAIDLTVSGSGPFTFSWADGAVTEDRNNLTAGTYNVTVTSSEGCPATASITVNGPMAALTPTATMTNVLCAGASTGAIDLTVTGGTAPYTYVWSNGATTQDVSGLVAGNYSVTVTDANSCTAVLSKTISQPTPLNLGALPTHPTCPGATDGDPQDLSGLSAGSFTVVVTDASGCTATTTVTLTEVNNLPPPPSGVNH